MSPSPLSRSTASPLATPLTTTIIKAGSTFAGRVVAAEAGTALAVSDAAASAPAALALLHHDLRLRDTRSVPDPEQQRCPDPELRMDTGLPVSGAGRQYDTHLLRKG